MKCHKIFIKPIRAFAPILHRRQRDGLSWVPSGRPAPCGGRDWGTGKTRLKFLFVLRIVAWLLPVTLVHSSELVQVESGRPTATQALMDRYLFMIRQCRPHGFINLDQQELQLDWVRRAAPVFPLHETAAVIVTEYTFRGERHTLDEYFAKNNVLGFLVLHEDRILLEKYFHNAKPTSRFLSNSMAKSIVSILIGTAIEAGKIGSVNDPVVRYLPFLAESGFKKTTIKDLLQMAAGIRWKEDYLAPDSDFPRIMLAWAQGAPAFSELMSSCESAEPPGERFEYQSIVTQALGTLLEAATGMPLNEYCEKALWRKLGAESDAFFYRGRKQPQILAAAGFCASLRDYARFGLMVMNGGSLGVQRVVSEDWVLKSTTLQGASELPKTAGPNREFAENLGYAYQWWLLDGGVFMAMGIYGQAIYINPARRVVIVQASAWPDPDPDEYWDEMITVMSVLAETVRPQKCFMREVWEENYPFYQKILNLPFNRELLRGELDEHVFKDYIIQDYHYLQNFRKVYGLLLAKAPDETAMKVIVKLINGIDEEIESIHAKYLAKYEISQADIAALSPSPNTEFYNSFLIKTATIEPFEVGLMATLPCHWIYYQLGVDMKRLTKTEGNKYREWIDEYAEASWETSDAKTVVDFVEKLMRKTTAETRNKMTQAFETAMKLEYMFWDGVYRGGRWID